MTENPNQSSTNQHGSITIDSRADLSSGIANPKLRRTLTLPLLSLYGLGVTVGAGIYVLIGETASLAGPYAPAAFLLAAIVVGFTAFSYAELATRFPVSAGEAAYVEAGLRRIWLARIVGLGVAISGIVSASAVAIGAGGYLADLIGLSKNTLTVAVVLSMGVIAWWGITQSVLMASVVTVIEIAGLGVVIFWGFWVAEPSGVVLAAMVPPMQGEYWIGIGAASLLAFFAFVGFEDMVNVAEEVKNPTKTLPRAITITLVVATLFYVGVSCAVLFAVPVEVLTASDAPLMLVFANGSSSVQSGFAAVAVIATVNGVLIQIIMASRVLYGMADRGQLPAILSRVSPLTRTPTVATVSVVLVILFLTQALPIQQLASYTSQIVLSVFIFVNISLIAIKLRGDTGGDHFKTSLAIPVMGVLTSLALFATSLL
ncbi:MAG: amino acid permease [Pseudomonadota bacterium]